MALISVLWNHISVPVMSDAGCHGDEGAVFSIMSISEENISIQEETFKLPTGINDQTEVEREMEKLSVTKTQLPVIKTVCLGLLAGMWITLAECGAIAIAGPRIPVIRQMWSALNIVVAGGVGPRLVRAIPILPRLLLAMVSPVSIHFILIYGGEYFGANCV